MTYEPNDSNEIGITDALARLRHSVEVPPVDPARERTLLAAFDAHRARPRQAAGRVMWAAAAALIAITVSLNWFVMRPLLRPSGASEGKAGLRPSVVSADQSDSVVDLAGFVAWPGASAWPPLESGSLMRVDVPVSMLPSLGLSAPSASATVVQADIVVGQDGFARAFRLVQ